MTNTYRSRPRDEAAEQLEYFIIQTGMQPNERLPSERQMCQMWGLNRTTLRGAIHKLIVEGKLYSKLGSGTYVAPPKMERNLQDMELMASVAAKAGKTLTSRVLSMDVIESNKQIAQKLKVTLGHKIFCLSRLRIADGIPTLIETACINYDLCPGIERHDFATESLYHVLESDYDCKVTWGQEKLSITYTTEEESAALGIPENMAVFFLSGVTEREDGMPVEYFKGVVRSDQIRFSSVLTHDAMVGQEEGV